MRQFFHFFGLDKWFVDASYLQRSGVLKVKKVRKAVLSGMCKLWEIPGRHSNTGGGWEVGLKYRRTPRKMGLLAGMLQTLEVNR